jgi:hypothetical protein
MLHDKGKKFPRGPRGPRDDRALARAISAALKGELGSTHQAAKIAMKWTSAKERTVKNWLAGTHSPNGEHLISLAKHSDAVLMYILAAANRPGLSAGVRWINTRNLLLELIREIDVSLGIDVSRD